MGEGPSKQDIYVGIGGRCSSKLEVTTGVKQRSMSRPFLYLPFINDLASVLKSPNLVFADDVEVIGSTGRNKLSSDVRFIQDLV